MIELDRTASTNDHLRHLAAQGAPHGTAVLARAQTQGRGRLGRSWLTVPGQAVLLSVLVRRPLPSARVPLLTLAAAVAVAETVDGLGIKWPNDLLAPDGRKVCGILAEAEFDRGKLGHGVVGIGLNVTGAPDLDTATCLARAFPDRRFERVALADQITRGLLALVDVLATDPDAVLERWRARSVTLGRSVRVGAVEGIAEDVAPSGALQVRTAAGLEPILAGDVELVRPL